MPGAELTIGQEISHYRIVARLGAGGMGEVYRARDAKLGRDVALKVLPQAFARDADRMARFQREAKVLASLNHPNIASIYGLEDSGSTHALVMELVEGPTLADRIRQGPISVDEALKIAKQICEALEYAHERGIVHRDLKPANVKVTADDAVKVLDFGLAKALEGDAASFDISTSPTLSRLATMQGVLLGTAAYMSPEQAKGKSVDRRADIWAFGCVLYEMLAGKMAFHGESVTDTLAAVIRAEPDWALLPSATPIRVRVLLQRCMQKDPKQRLRDIGDARISIEEVLSGTPDPALAGASQIPVSRWQQVLPWTVAALLFAALAPIAFLYFRGTQTAQAEPMQLQIPLPEKTTMSINGTFAVSPNGRQLAFAATGPDGVTRLWIRPLDSLEARLLPGTEAPQFPPFFWSPDSRFIAFDAGGKLKKIDISGGPAQTVCDLPASAVGGSWNRDGVIILAQAPGPIMRVSADGGTPTPLTTFSLARGETGHLFPSFLPDGRHFLYGRFSLESANVGFFVGSLDAKPEEQSTKPLASKIESNYMATGDGSGDVLFIRDGSLVEQPLDMRRLELTGEPVTVAEHVGTFGGYGFFSASDNGVLVYRAGTREQSLQLTWFDRQGRALATAGEPRSFLSAALSPDAARVAFSDIGTTRGVVSGNGLWLLDVSRGTSTRFTFGVGVASAVWSPDGDRIVFASRGTGLYEKPASGIKDEQLLLKLSGDPRPTSWSRDGRFLLYTAQPAEAGAKASLWVLPLEGGKEPVPFLRTEFNERDGHFSPDGHWVAYTSDESGRNEIYIRAFSPNAAGAASDAGGGLLISSNGGTEPRWRGDGRELFYRAADGKLMAAEVTLAPVLRVGIPKALFQMPPEGGPATGSTWDTTSDGQRFLMSVPRSTTTPFTVVLNWQAALRK
jgi:eukaryotic-like serine/threonine-protein kinase